MRLRGGWLWFALLPPACIAYQWLIHSAIVDAQTMPARLALAVLNGFPHAAINALMMWVFGRTLLHGSEPLITAFARRIHGTVPDYIEPYTRRVTAAWCIFFALQVLLSVILLAVAPLHVWSLFVNVLSFPLIILMFVAEYLYRIVRFPGHAHASIWQGVAAFVGHAQDARAAEARSHNR